VSASAAVKQVTIKIDVRSDDGVLVASGRARSIVRDDAA
jgi:hypothetical protein